jgi:hypothetical protein
MKQIYRERKEEKKARIVKRELIRENNNAFKRGLNGDTVMKPSMETPFHNRMLFNSHLNALLFFPRRLYRQCCIA